MKRGRETVTPADWITLSRFVFGFLVLYFILQDRIILAGILYFIGAFTDFLDGQVARRFNEKTKLGGTLDAIADRFLVILTLGGLWFTGNLNYLIKIVFLVWLVMEITLAPLTAIKTRKIWISSTHRNAMRLAAFFAFVSLGWAMLSLPYLSAWCLLTILFILVATIDHLFWFLGKKWKTHNRIEKRLKSSFLRALMN